MKRLINCFIMLLFLINFSFAETKMIPASFKDVADAIKESVVNISTITVIKQTNPFYSDPFFDDDFLYRFFGIPRGTFKTRSLGTGVIISPDGYILTNNHVVESADEITVKLYNQKEYKAKVVGKDKETDIAVIKINAKGLKPAKIGDSDKIEVGDWVIAVGSPFGLEQTVTQGIISAKGRIIGAGPYDDFLQTDAAINPGNSGGPLINLDGEVIGINTAITSRSGGYEGIGFSIPINMAKKVYDDIIQKGKVVRGWLGVAIQDLTPELAKYFKVNEGVLVSEVFANGPAKKAGLQRGDVIVEFDGKKIKKYRELQSIVAATPVNKTVEVKVIRKGKETSCKIKVGERNPDAVLEPEKPEISQNENNLGIIVSDITEDVASQYGISKGEGVVVISVGSGTAAEDAGIMRGDIIHEINGKHIKNVEDFNNAVKTAKKNEQVVILIERGNSMLYLAFNLR
ncbi:MAG TPA: DegQ family serine endoprotease [Candidatus Goldiibacteriota bacterium]|nr:DegQ family serine endoprotease [Candidatus Goldiibacteriota bacterium]